jgi:hypothetical protein
MISRGKVDYGLWVNNGRALNDLERFFHLPAPAADPPARPAMDRA